MDPARPDTHMSHGEDAALRNAGGVFNSVCLTLKSVSAGRSPGPYATVSVTSILPRVALEYGQT